MPAGRDEVHAQRDGVDIDKKASLGKPEVCLEKAMAYCQEKTKSDLEGLSRKDGGKSGKEGANPLGDGKHSRAPRSPQARDSGGGCWKVPM
jgi:hypothetical protein